MPAARANQVYDDLDDYHNLGFWPNMTLLEKETEWRHCLGLA